jgi:metal transporter CNNM
VVDEDLILLWTDAEKRIITGADILGRLLRGITRAEDRGADLP